MLPSFKLKHFCFVVFAMGLTGCAQQPTTLNIINPVFPPPPEKPKLIYEGTLRSGKDVQEITFADKIKKIATGIIEDPLGLAKPYGVAVKNGRVYVTDTQQRAILMFDIRNQAFNIFGIEGDGNVLKPLGIDISILDEIFVADITAKRIVVFDLDGNYLRSLGNGAIFIRPSGVTVSRNGQTIFVVDTGGLDSEQHRILVLDAKTGHIRHIIGQRGTAPGEFNLPLQASTAPNGKLYVVDSGNFRVQAFNTEDYSFSHSFGSLGRKSGNFSRPKGIATDNDSNVYVVDTAFGNFQVFNPQGTLLLFVGTRSTLGGPAKYMLPAGIDVDEEGRVYIVDQFFRKIDVYRPVQLPPQGNLPKF